MTVKSVGHSFLCNKIMFIFSINMFIVILVFESVEHQVLIIQQRAPFVKVSKNYHCHV